MILFDIGAEVSGYAADVSRVYALQKPTSRQVQLFNAVYDVQQQIMQLARPGVTILELEQKTQMLLSSKLPALKLYEPIKHYYPHGVSHHLGLDVHDTADYHVPLQKNMIITIEPGLYIPEESIGIRIEDDILITDTAPKNLSANIPHDLLYYL
jgi:Xaa-Pro aminopeptidase